MVRLYSTVIILAVLVSGCSQPAGNLQAVKAVRNGGTFRINESDILRTVYSPAIQDNVSSHIVFQIFEGLVKYAVNNLSIIPAVAESWDIDESGKEFTFHLRDNVYFHDDECFEGGKGRKVTAADFKYTFELLCTRSEQNSRFKGMIDKITGAEEYYEASGNGKPAFELEGVKVIDDRTLQITIDTENPMYIYLLADISAVVLPREGIEKYGVNNTVGSGPFILRKFEEEATTIDLIKNQAYYGKDEDGNSLPYLDEVQVSFVSVTPVEINLFEEGKLDIVTGLTQKYVTDFMEKNIAKFESNPPEFIVDGSEDFAAYELFNMRRSTVNNFYSNRMNIIDLSIVYFSIPKKRPDDKVLK